LFQQRAGHWFISLEQLSQVSPFSWMLLGQVALQLQTSFSQVRQVSPLSIIPFQQTGFFINLQSNQHSLFFQFNIQKSQSSH
jgi:hypothetical protein